VEVTDANELDALALDSALAAQHGRDLATRFAGAPDRMSNAAWHTCIDQLGAYGIMW
jgi:hypothetical protein